MTSIALVSLVNRPAEHAECRKSLLRGGEDPRVAGWHVIHPNERGWNAAQGLNAGLDAAAGDWVVLVHQDVRFPPGWIDRFTEQVGALPGTVAVVGAAGTTRAGTFRGHLVDPNGHCFWPPPAADVLTLDECLLAVRGGGTLRFDPLVPGFHCYGAELCLRAAAEGRGIRTIDAPVLHLSTGRLDAAYAAASKYVLEKWGPTYGHFIPTTAAEIVDPARASAWRRFLGRFVRRNSTRTDEGPCASPVCGDLLAALRSAPHP